MNRRREFVQGAVATGLVLLAPRTSRAAEARIDVLADEPIGTISPSIYGHFVKHLGGVVYDGIWVGEGSKVPNVNGIRRAFLEHMRRIKPGVVRWPGGCFADMYNWRDGIGPRDKRPRRTNFWRDDRGNRSSEDYRRLDSGPQKYEPNWFGTNEFMAFCRQTGAQPYFAANVRSLPAQDFQEWVDYCNAPAGATTLSDMRAAAGDREPYRVEFWGVGNESWGCGGRLTPEEYSQEFRRFIAYEDKFVATPNFHVFEMYAAHQGGQAVRTLFSAPAVAFKRSPPSPPPAVLAQMTPPQRAAFEAQAQSTAGTLWGLQGSASVSGKRVTLTVVNPHATEARAAEIVVRGAAVQSADALVLSATDIHAHNSFENPRALEPASVPVEVQGGRLVHRFPAASVTRFQLALA